MNIKNLTSDCTLIFLVADNLCNKDINLYVIIGYTIPNKPIVILPNITESPYYFILDKINTKIINNLLLLLIYMKNLVLLNVLF